MKGIVYLVGAGPGDPGLITVRGHACLKIADVVYYDSLANNKLLGEMKPGAIKIAVGKRKSLQLMDQHAIEQAMIRDATLDKTVVRLKGGDPFIFGRGGEEALALNAANIPFEIVPGVSSAFGVPAYAGIPLTHRGIASEVALVTGHSDIRSWQAIASMDTIVFLMGTSNLESNMEKLMAYGASPSTPAALIQWGTYPHQKTAIATIATLSGEVKKINLGPPALVVVGKVVTLRDQLNWFETKPLFGKRVVITRSRNQQSELETMLTKQGAEVLPLSVLEIVPPASFKALDSAISKIKKFDWILFTSSNAVHAFERRLLFLKKSIREMSHIKIAAIGEATAGAIKTKGWWVDCMPKKYHAEALLEEFKKKKIKDVSILFPRAVEAREILVQGLKKLGCRLSLVEAYRNKIPKYSREELDSIFVSKKPDWILFTSSSAIHHLATLIGKKQFVNYLNEVKVACIGPITKKTALDYGLPVSAMPKKATMEELANCILP